MIIPIYCTLSNVLFHTISNYTLFFDLFTYCTNETTRLVLAIFFCHQIDWNLLINLIHGMKSYINVYLLYIFYNLLYFHFDNRFLFALYTFTQVFRWNIFDWWFHTNCHLILYVKFTIAIYNPTILCDVLYIFTFCKSVLYVQCFFTICYEVFICSQLVDNFHIFPSSYTTFSQTVVLQLINDPNCCPPYYITIPFT